MMSLPGQKQRSLQGGTEGGLDTHGLLGNAAMAAANPKGTIANILQKYE